MEISDLNRRIMNFDKENIPRRGVHGTSFAET